MPQADSIDLTAKDPLHWRIVSNFQFGDSTARFITDDASGRVGLMLFPTALASQLAERRMTLHGLAEIDALPDGGGDAPAIAVDSLVQMKLVGDAYGGAFAQGRTMRDASSVDAFRLHSQRVVTEEDRTIVVTELRGEGGRRVEHSLSWHEGDQAAEIVTAFRNESSRPVTLEMLSSFSLCGITPFAQADAPGRLRVHRFRSAWSAEGRLDTQTIEQLALERSWSGASALSERFGQVGSMPVRGWFPFVAVEDTETGVCWGAQLAWAGSWQMEIFRRHDDVCISGGLADREFGHWIKTLEAGESLTTPPAVVACTAGSLDDLCDRLTSLGQRAVDKQPAVERDLPIVFNEWCTTWGEPSHKRMAALAQRLAGTAVRYLVIDAGWYTERDGSWSDSHGDWIPSRKLFPHGLAATAAAIREQGLIPGLWFEVETVGANATSFSWTGHLLKRDGIPITVRARRFWNMNDTEAVEFLHHRVIEQLQQCGFGYLKIDYNETIGIGCEGAESLGEGLRQQILGVYRFFDRVRSKLPDLVIENCSSGGHRLEPSMIGRTAMSSFSDAHELKEIPIIAANLHRLMLPRQSQVWAVLHRSDDDQRLVYTLASTFLGRMCLSGEVDRLSESQWALVKRALQLYRQAAPTIKRGTSRRFGQMGPSWRYPRGWQAMMRTNANQSTALVVIHAFEKPPAEARVPLAANHWRIADQFHVGNQPARIEEDQLIWPIESDFCAAVILLSNAVGGAARKPARRAK
jgi:alpha-galactosidase